MTTAPRRVGAVDASYTYGVGFRSPWRVGHILRAHADRVNPVLRSRHQARHSSSEEQRASCRFGKTGTRALFEARVAIRGSLSTKGLLR